MQEFKVLFSVCRQDACCLDNGVSLSIGSACRSIFLQTSLCLIGSSSELYPRVLQTIISINVCFSYVFQCNYFIFFHYSNTPPPQTAEEKWFCHASVVMLFRSKTSILFLYKFSVLYHSKCMGK